MRSRVWSIPPDTHCHILPLLCKRLPVYDEICRRSANYEGALNHPPSQPCQELDDAASTRLPDADIADNAPSLDEVQRAIRRLKNSLYSDDERLITT